MTPQWLPDWKEASKYPSALPLNEWPWQFLRRNPEYQKLWDEMILPHFDEATGSIDGIEGGFAYEASHAFRERFGINLPLAPHPSNDCKFLPFAQSGVRINLPSQRPEHMGALKEDELKITFDLSWPIQPQIERAMAFLEARQRWLIEKGKVTVVNSRNHVALYPTYLRLLDAEAAGASINEMSEHLFPGHAGDSGRQRARDNLKAARRMRDTGYRYITL